MIKVLWIDDQEFEQLENIAEDYDVDLIHVYSWLEAEKKLKGSQFDEWDAIIFDCYCTMVPGGNEDEHFLRKAFSRFYKICGENRIIPWYIFSQGNGDRFENIIDNQLEEDRLEWDSDWEKVYYSKATDYKQLLENIKAMAPKRQNYAVRHRYIDFFNAVENTERYGNIKEMIFPVLKAIHYPNDSDLFNAVDYYNKLRKIVEQVFYSCNRMGILPDELITESTGVNLSWSSIYLAGMTVGQLNIRYGDESESFFPSAIASSIKNILFIANINSHSADLTDKEKSQVNDYFSGIASEYIIFGLTMNLMSVVLWYESYLESGHDNIEDNKKKCRKMELTEEEKAIHESVIGVVTKDDVGFYHVKDVSLTPNTAKDFEGKTVLIKKPILNSNEKTKTRYPRFSLYFEEFIEENNGSKNEGTNQM